MKLRVFLLITSLFLISISAAAAAGQSAEIYVTQREDHIYTGDESTELVKCYSKGVIVRIPDDPGAEAYINAALSDVENKMMNECRGSIPAQEEVMREIAEHGENWRPMFTLEMRHELTPQRTTGGIISFEAMDYTFSGGAHGMYGVNGKTFDTQTGRELRLSDLSRQPEAFREACISEMVRQGLLMENLWYTTAQDLRPMVEAIADRDSWYLTDQGIVFHSSPYELAPYSEGAIEFLVTYDLLPEMKY